MKTDTQRLRALIDKTPALEPYAELFKMALDELDTQNAVLDSLRETENVVIREVRDALYSDGWLTPGRHTKESALTSIRDAIVIAIGL